MITFELIRDTVDNVYRRACCDLRGAKDLALEKALKETIAREESPAAKLSAEIMLDAIKASEEKKIVICGDTGLPIYIVKVGSKVATEVPEDITKAIQAGVARFFDWSRGDSWLSRWPGVHPVNRSRTMPPPVIHYGFLPGKDYIEIAAVPKGTGSTPYSAADVLSWELGLVKKYVIDCVLKAGPRACPPYFIGVGIGGALDTATMLATDALIRPIGERNPDPEIAKLEEELLGAVNELGIGPMGVGGKTTALAVNIEFDLSYAAPLIPGYGWVPSSVLVNCWPARWGKARIYADGRVEYL